jgi:pimeloyl-ACP methyl ester carboxylesterase
MRNSFALSLVVVLWSCGSHATAGWKKDSLEKLNQRIHGTLIDHSHNHGQDLRIWSEALHERRDLYVYVPPCYDPKQRYPLLVYLHGYPQDETTFLEAMVEWFDEVIANGKLPPVVIAFPDGSIQGKASYFLMQDVWNFLFSHYSLRLEREAHVLIGISLGGGAAYRLPLVYPDRFKLIIGFLPTLNLRWVDCHGSYRAPFDPCCWGWRTTLNPHELMGRFYGLIPVRYGVLTDPLVGRGPDAIRRISEVNPIELLDVYDVRPGQFDMYIAYAGNDELNIPAQVNSYLYKARERHLPITVAFDPEGKHRLETGKKLFPAAIEWMAPLLAPYSSPLHPGSAP